MAAKCGTIFFLSLLLLLLTATSKPGLAAPYCGDLLCDTGTGENQLTCCTDCGCPVPSKNSCCDRRYVCSRGISCIPSDAPDNSACRPYEYCSLTCACVSNACSSYVMGIGCNTNPNCDWCAGEEKCKLKSDFCAIAITPTPSPVATPKPELIPGVGSCGVFCGNVVGDCAPCQKCTVSAQANYRCEPESGCPGCRSNGSCGETHSGKWPASCTSICSAFGLDCNSSASCGSSCVSGGCNASCGSNASVGMEVGCVCTKPALKAAPTHTARPSQPAAGNKVAAEAALSGANTMADDADAQVAQAESEGRDASQAKSSLTKARELLREAESDFERGDYTKAEALASDAFKEAQETITLIPARRAFSMPVFAWVIVLALLAAVAYSIRLYFAAVERRKKRPPIPEPAYYRYYYPRPQQDGRR